VIKRIFDICLALFGLLLSSPIWILFGALILIEDGWPIFYLQERIGENRKKFKALKFRSMIKDAEKGVGPIQATENDPRITKMGKILRATAMDELPQLINILKGDMSFVGPRAMRPQEMEIGNEKSNKRNRKFEIRNKILEIQQIKREENSCNSAIPVEKIPGYYERQSVRAGLTGLAQIYLPKDAYPQEKFSYDLLYIKKQSFWFDLKLIFLSFWITFKGKWESRQKKL